MKPLRLKLALLPEERAALDELFFRVAMRAMPKNNPMFKMLALTGQAIRDRQRLNLTAPEAIWLACFLEAKLPRLTRGSHLSRAADYLAGTLKHDLAIRGVLFRYFDRVPARVIVPRGYQALGSTQPGGR